LTIKSTDISNAIFSPLKSWAEQSTGNWNILIGVGFLLLMGSAIFTYVCYKKIGQDDERTNKIFLNKVTSRIRLFVLEVFSMNQVPETFRLPKIYLLQLFHEKT